MQEAGNTAIGILFIVIFFALPVIGWFITYFLPAIAALVRKKHDRLRIVLLNLFLGWVSPLWIYLCVCAFLDNPTEPTQP